MTVVTTFFEKHRHKQLDFERQALQALTINNIEEAVNQYFEPYLNDLASYRQAVEDMCLDYAIESFLIGASYGKFGYYGETIDQVYERSHAKSKHLLDDLYDYWLFWSNADDQTLESIYMACDHYLYYWWKEGFEHIEKRHRMKLH